LLEPSTYTALLSMIAKCPARKAVTLCKVQVGISRGEAQKTVKHLTGDGDVMGRTKETELPEEGDSVVLVGGHD
jgi:hypothetical protein